MNANTNRATQILAEQLLDAMFGCSGGPQCAWDSERVEWYFDEEMTNHLNGDYDYGGADDGLNYPDWLPLVATPAIRETINWEYIAEKANDYEYDTEIEWLFGDNE